MKILYFITKSNFGGAQRYVFDLARLAKKEGFDVAVCGGEDKSKTQGSLEDRLRSEEIKFIPLENLIRDLSLLSDIRGFFEITRIIRREKPDVVHFNSSKMGMGILASKILKVLTASPRRIIFTAHGWPFNEERPPYQKALIKFISWISVILSDITVTVAVFDYNKGIAMPGVKNKIYCIHNGIENAELLEKEVARKEITRRLDINFTSDINFVTVAELTNNKGLEYLIEAAEAFKDQDVSFTVIGEGELREDLSKLIEEKKMKDKVLMLGRLEGVESYLKAYDGFILSSIKEGLPYVLLETGRAGLPVIATSVGGVPEIIEDMKSGILVRKKDTDELVKAIKYFLDNREAVSGFGSELQDKIAKDFNWSRMAKETFQLYKEG